MNRKFIAAAALILISAGSLTSCGSSKTATAYGIVDNDCVAAVTLSVLNGKVTSVSIDETFSVNLWARINPDELTSQGISIDTISAEITQYGTTATIYLPKYISLGGYIYDGTLSTDGDYTSAGEYVTYMAEDTIKAPSGSNDLFKYISSSDSGVNLGSKAGWYYNCLAKGNYAVLGYETSDASKALVKAGYTLNIPGSLFKGSADSTYWQSGTSGLGWKANISAICSYFVGKTIAPVIAASDDTVASPVISQDDSGTWLVDGVSTGATISSFEEYYTIANNAFASVEYSSYGLF